MIKDAADGAKPASIKLCIHYMWESKHQPGDLQYIPQRPAGGRDWHADITIDTPLEIGNWCLEGEIDNKRVKDLAHRLKPCFALSMADCTGTFGDQGDFVIEPDTDAPMFTLRRDGRVV